MEFTAGARLEVRISPADVGRRVSVRSVTTPGEPGARFTDTVGVLTAWRDGVLYITRRNGEQARVPEATLVAGKVVPRVPARRRGVPAARPAELARIAARAWPAVEREPLGGWLLRAADGFTHRANSVLALGDPGMPLDAALERVTAWYAARGLPACAQLTTGGEGTEDRLVAELEARGWRVVVTAEVWTAGLAAVVDAASGAPSGEGAGPTPRVVLSRTPGPDWFARCHRFAGRPPTATQEAVVRGGPSVWFATVPEDGAPAGAPAAAVGRCVVDGRWAGFSAVEVAPELRGRGLATALLAALARQALAEGATAGYLEVETDNAPARRLYHRLGFARHHAYHHRRAPEH